MARAGRHVHAVFSHRTARALGVTEGGRERDAEEKQKSKNSRHLLVPWGVREPGGYSGALAVGQASAPPARTGLGSACVSGSVGSTGSAAEASAS